MIEIVPSILSADFARLADDIARVERGGAKMLHLDVMDGHFVPNLTIGPPVVECVRKITGLHLDVHLMIENPERFVTAFVQAGANSVSVHYVLDLLLLDEGNPRSAAFQISKLRKHVDRLPESHPASGHPKEARLALSMLTSIQLAEASELIRADEDGQLSDLEQFTARLTADLASLSEILSRVYFTHAVKSRQLDGRRKPAHLWTRQD